MFSEKLLAKERMGYFLGGTEEIYEKYQGGSFVSGPIFELEDPNSKQECCSLLPKFPGLH
jgi:hypothetical protein